MTFDLRVLGLIGSPGAGGFTSQVVDAVLAGSRSAGASAFAYELCDGDQDGAAAQVQRADAIVFGSPTYRASHTALVASLLERLERRTPPERGGPLAGKAAAIVMTGASDCHFLATEKLRTTLSCFFAVQVLAPSLYVGQTNRQTDRALDEASRITAALHGKALVELSRAVRAGSALQSLAPIV
ncbi:NAD(P)H-dependent oxidoreductase [Nocardioides immobilis]|uniref:NAD(P)H-dependent oxidoreductase n=1 Tax=Nocardioides immobilis TaxID=2049295 RepID=UPI0015F8AE30